MKCVKNTSGVGINGEIFMGVGGNELQSKFYGNKFGRKNREESRKAVTQDLFLHTIPQPTELFVFEPSV